MALKSLIEQLKSKPLKWRDHKLGVVAEDYSCCKLRGNDRYEARYNGLLIKLNPGTLEECKQHCQRHHERRFR